MADLESRASRVAYLKAGLLSVLRSGAKGGYLLGEVREAVKALADRSRAGDMDVAPYLCAGKRAEIIPLPEGVGLGDEVTVDWGSKGPRTGRMIAWNEKKGVALVITDRGTSHWGPIV